MLDYDLHPPDDVRLFVVDPPGVLRLDDQALVTETRHGENVLRHYAFRDEWFKVNCTTDLSGALVETSTAGGHPFAFNCDISTPMLRSDDAVFSVDLFVDVLLAKDATAYRIAHENELGHAIEQGWLSEREGHEARRGLAHLVALIERGQLLELLAGAHPFGPSSAPHAHPVRHLPVAAAPGLRPRVRPTW